MNFDPCNLPLKIRESIETPTPKVNSQSGSSLRSVGVHSLTLFYIPESMKYDSRTSLLAHTFVSLCLGREPKARVMIKLQNIKVVMFDHLMLRV
jgi:hypothetical protein